MTEPAFTVLFHGHSTRLDGARPRVERLDLWVDTYFPWVVLARGAARFHRTFSDAIENAHDIATRGGAS